MNAERQRLEESKVRKVYWKRWGPYLSERQWGTVREDYSADGTAWDYFPHDHARSRAYRWGEDGLGGISDNHQRLCFAVALWNGQDPILKERLFGLSGPQGNHGEDVKEYYFYLDSTPTHSYLKFLYKYPQAAFPYAQLVAENARRDKSLPEYELLDTGIFEGDRYFDVFVEYAKNSAEDILVRIEIFNRGPQAAAIQLLPTLWFRNTWSWQEHKEKPSLSVDPGRDRVSVVRASHPDLGSRWLHCEGPDELLFTENETNYQRLFSTGNQAKFVKDGINDFIVSGRKDAVNGARTGTKMAAHYALNIPAGESRTVRLRLTDQEKLAAAFGSEFDSIFAVRMKEADEFYQELCPFPISDDERRVQRQAFAGMLWNKQYYNYVVDQWLKGDPGNPAPPADRLQGRNHEWDHFYADDVLSMPDKWEYPWFASWDLAFHTIPLAMIDPEFAKRQLLLLTREWYMHPNGQIPAYEWKFSDVNPPVHAWAALRVFRIEKRMTGRPDLLFLERVFQKLLLNFTWWVNRKDAEGNNIFEGGFLGLDNVGIFDRSAPLPTGGLLEQADGTSWMAMYCLNMLAIALELAPHNPSYEDIASKFLEHFIYIADAINNIGHGDLSLWDEEDGFFYDVLRLPDGRHFTLKIRSMVGLIPLFAVETLDPDVVDLLPGFKSRLEWFIKNRPDLTQNIACMETRGVESRRLLSIATKKNLGRILSRMLDETEFLGPCGIRSLSKYHEKNPYIFRFNGEEHCVDYEPAESTMGLFGGNSNWRGPVWFPVNYLLIEALQKFHYYLGDDFKVDLPTGSGRQKTLWEVASEISQRLTKTFLKDPSGRRPVYGGAGKFQNDPNWREYISFFEYFHGDNGAGIGAGHQTGWTGLVAKLIQQQGEYSKQNKAPDLSSENNIEKSTLKKKKAAVPR